MNYRTRLEAKRDELHFCKVHELEGYEALMTQTIALAEALELYGGASVYVGTEDSNISVAWRALDEFNQWLGGSDEKI